MQTAWVTNLRVEHRHPALVWAESGLMELSGLPDGLPAVASGSWVQRLQTVVDDIVAIRGGSLRTDAVGFLGERAALSGRLRGGSVSVGGACRMLAASDGVVAVSLARNSDIDAVPAWLQLEGGAVQGDNVWEVVAEVAQQRSVAELLERAGWLGLAVAEATRGLPPKEPCRFVACAAPRVPALLASVSSAACRAPTPMPNTPSTTARRWPNVDDGLVLDVSSLWAGPLCAELLGDFGLRVVKVEGPNRPDGTRFGDPQFYERLNGAKDEVLVDLDSLEGRKRFMALCSQAAVVVDGLRPRVWENWGISPLEVAGELGLVWVSITAHGDNRAGFGDDAAVAGGLWLSNPAGVAGSPGWFVGDAAADPIAGLVGCRAAAQVLAKGQVGVVQVAMSQAVSWVRAGEDLSVCDAELVRKQGKWWVRAGAEEQEVLPPRG